MEAAQGSVETVPAVQPAQETPQAPAMLDPFAEFKGKKFKHKIDGKEEEIDVEEALKAYPKAKSADKRFQEAAQIRKEVDKFLKGLQSGDAQSFDQLVKILGKKKAEEFAENLLLEKINIESMTPEQKKAWELEQENKTLKSYKDEQERAKIESERAQARQAAIFEIDSEISAALKELGKKPSPRLVARIAEQMLASLEATDDGLDEEGNPIPAKRIPAKDAMTRVLSDFKAELEEYVGGLPVDEALKVLPKNLLDAIRKAQVDQVITPLHKRSGQTPKEQGSTKSKKPRMRSDDWFSAMEEKFR